MIVIASHRRSRRIKRGSRRRSGSRMIMRRRSATTATMSHARSSPHTHSTHARGLVRTRPRRMTSPHSSSQYGTLVMTKQVVRSRSASPVPKEGIAPRLMKHLNHLSTKIYTPSLWPDMTRVRASTPVSIVPSGTSGTSEKLQTQNNEWSLPCEITNMFTISMRPHLMAQLFQRLGPWSQMVKHWPATDGRRINPNRWTQLGYLSKNNRLKRGQMGCSDAHASLWQTIVEHSLPMTLIMEDDPEFHYSEATSRRLHQIFDEIKTHQIQFDIMYLGSNTRNRGINTRHRVSPSLTRPVGCVGLFCYIVTLEGARKLLSRARPYVVPVDVYTINEANAGRIRHVHANPCFGFVFSRASDTQRIK